MRRTHLDLFSGIGGFALAARWAGVETVGFAEIDDYAIRVLAKNFPGVPNYGDVRNVPAGDGSTWLVTGGFPCQPFSVAGKRGGKGDDRWLWPEMAGVIERVRPAWVLGENVPGIIRMELDTVLSDLERIGYTVQAFVVPAVGVDAPHRRERVWIVAYADGFKPSTGSMGQDAWTNRWDNAERRSVGEHGIVAYADKCDSEWRAIQPQWKTQRGIAVDRNGTDVPDADNAGCVDQWRGVTDESQHAAVECGCRWQPEPNVGRVAYGVSRRVDRLRGLGNAIVPQVAYQFIRMMIAAEEMAL